MNLPRRLTDSIVRPSSRAASCLRFPGVTCFDENRADTMRRPGKCGSSERTTDSTSGNSGMLTALLRQVDQNVVALGLDRELDQFDVLVEIIDARSAIVRPVVPVANH